MNHFNSCSKVHFSSRKEAMLHFRVENIVREYDGLNTLTSVECTWLTDCMVQILASQVRLNSAQVNSKLQCLTNREGALIGRAFSGVICVSREAPA